MNPPLLVFKYHIPNSESIIVELEKDITRDSVNPAENKPDVESTETESKEKTTTDNANLGRLARINSWVKRHQRKSVSNEAAISMNFDFDSREDYFDGEMIAICSESTPSNCSGNNTKTLHMNSSQLVILNMLLLEKFFLTFQLKKFFFKY